MLVSSGIVMSRGDAGRALLQVKLGDGMESGEDNKVDVAVKVGGMAELELTVNDEIGATVEVLPDEPEVKTG
jgi:hypothetical protein